MSGIYIASKSRHYLLWQHLRDQRGIPICSTWIDEGEPGQIKDFADLWDRCINEAARADALVLYMEPGEILKGAYIELGAALTAGVPCFVVAPVKEFSTVRHQSQVTMCDNLHEAFTRAQARCAP